MLTLAIDAWHPPLDALHYAADIHHPVVKTIANHVWHVILEEQSVKCNRRPRENNLTPVAVGVEKTSERSCSVTEGYRAGCHVFKEGGSELFAVPLGRAVNYRPVVVNDDRQSPDGYEIRTCGDNSDFEDMVLLKISSSGFQVEKEEILRGWTSG